MVNVDLIDEEFLIHNLDLFDRKRNANSEVSSNDKEASIGTQGVDYGSLK